MATDWSLTKGGLAHLPPFLRPIQRSIDEQNRRVRLQRMDSRAYWIKRFVRVCAHIHICKVSSAEAPGEWADWWTWIRANVE